MVNNNTGSGTGTGSVTVESGARIGGCGAIDGNLTMKDGSRFVFDGNPKTTLAVSGELVLGAAFGIDDLDIDWKTIPEGTYKLIVNKGDFSTIENWGEENKITGLAGGRAAWLNYISGSKGLALTVVQ